MKRLIAAIVLFTSTLLVGPVLERELSEIPEWGWHSIYVFLAVVFTYWVYSSESVSSWVHRSPFGRPAAIIATLAFVGVVAFWAFTLRTPSFWPDVHPTELHITMRELVSHHEFTITNSSDSPIYATWIAITGPEHDPGETVNIELPLSSIDGRRFEVVRLLKNPPEAFLMTGKGAHGDSAAFLVVRAMEPNSSRTYRLNVVSKIPVLSPVELKIGLELLSASETPDRFQTGDRSTWMNYKRMPKGLTLHSLDDLWIAVLLEKGDSQDGNLPPAKVQVETPGGTGAQRNR